MFHGTPKYSQTPHFQRKSVNFHSFSILGFRWSLCSYLDSPHLPPPARFRLHDTFLLKTLQGLIMAIRCLLCPSLSSFFSSLTQLWPHCCSWNIPGALLFQDLCTSCFLCLVFFTQMSIWLTPAPPVVPVQTLPSQRSVLTTPFRCTPLPSPAAGLLKSPLVCPTYYFSMGPSAYFLSVSLHLDSVP